MKRNDPVRRLTVSVVAALMMATGAVVAQMEPEGGPLGPGIASQPVKNAEVPIKILQPTVDKKTGTITIPAAFWNQHMTSWVEVALCGRPSDFLHETIACVTTTKEVMMQSMREVGFRDADHWVNNVRDFPRIRGDRALVLLEVTRENNKKEIYALDELINFQGWGVPVGPYGWMYKGDPERGDKKSEEKDPKAEPDQDRTKILHDDPQIAVQFKGIQHMSQSFMDHALCYDDWIYPMARYGRNYHLLTDKIYDSNGDVPVNLIIRKVNEEQFLTEIAKVWHDEKCRDYILKQLPTAVQIDKDKGELEGLLPEQRKLMEVSVEMRDQAKVDEVAGRTAVLAASIEKGYAALDAAWAVWAEGHPVYEAQNDKDLEALKKQAALWREHMELTRESAAQTYLATDAAYQQKLLSHGAQTDEVTAKLVKLRGTEIAARSAATLAENKHPMEYWHWESARIDRIGDPRTDWIKHIDVQNELVDAREAAAKIGVEYGKALTEGNADVATLQKRYAAGLARVAMANLNVRLADTVFEINKREGLDDDPDLPGLRKLKKAIEDQIEIARAVTQPATMPKP